MFTHLHVHTHYSALDGMCHINELVSTAKKMGHTHVGITDHGIMSAVYDLYKECKSQGIQPVYGIEFYHRVEGFDKRLHITAWAKNMTGLKNLYALHELSYRNAEVGAFGKRFPIVTYEDLFKYGEGLVVATACLAGHIPQCIINGRKDETYQTIELLHARFGEDFYLEVQPNSIKEQAQVNIKLIELSRLYNIKCIATNDVHYMRKDDAKVHEMLLCMQTKDKMNNEKRFKFSVNDFWFKTEDEMREGLAKHGIAEIDIRAMFINTMEIAQKCSFDLEIPKPEEALPRYSDDETTALRQLVTKGWKEKRHAKTKREKERADYELDIIENKGYSGYYLIVSDYINWAKSNNIVVGGGRGSGVGSFVAYLTGMTTVNPIEHGLLFERFLNPERMTSPDFDVDFSDQQAVINYLRRKWGDDNVSMIIAFGTLTAKAVIRGIMRIHGFSEADINKLSKSLPKKLELTLEDCEKSEEFASFKQKHPDLVNAMYRLEGTIDHISQHAAGVLITPKSIREFVPALYNHDLDILVAGFDKYMLEAIGLYKFDILKLTTLNVIDDCIKSIKEHKGIDIDFVDMQHDDEEVYKDLCNGEVFGVFQLESQQDLTKKLQPRDFEALTALNALIRPGVGDIETYTARMNGEPFEYYHEAEKSYMAQTYGTITYQEQFMMRVHTLAGWTLGKGDSLRKVKKIRENTELAEEFYKGCFDTRLLTSHQDAEKAWNEIVDALEGGYSFNKSHACSYADISYQTAWLKHYYPVEYMAALMTSERLDQSKIAERIEQCKKMGIKLLSPDINKSDETYRVEGDAIRFSINTIKGVGESALMEINRVRPVSDLDDLCVRGNLRVLDKSVIGNLIKSGCFDFQGVSRNTLLNRYFIVYRNDKKYVELGEVVDTRTLAQYEKETLGFYLTRSPIDDYAFKPISDYPIKGNAVIGGEITKIKEIFDKNNRKMAFATLTTQHGNVELIVFARDYTKLAELIAEGNLVMVKGKRDADAKMIVNEVFAL